METTKAKAAVPACAPGGNVLSVDIERPEVIDALRSCGQRTSVPTEPLPSPHPGADRRFAAGNAEEKPDFRPKSREELAASMTPARNLAIEQFRDAIRAAELTPPDAIEADGGLHRWRTGAFQAVSEER